MLNILFLINSFSYSFLLGKYHEELDTHTYSDAPDNGVDDEQVVTDKFLTTLISSTTNEPRRSDNGENADVLSFTNYNALNTILLRPSGNMVKIKCPAKGTPFPKWEWTKDGLPIDRKLGSVQVNKMGITLEDLIPADSGNYTCKICNIHGCISHSTKLEVSGKIKALIEN